MGGEECHQFEEDLSITLKTHCKNEKKGAYSTLTLISLRERIRPLDRTVMESGNK